MRFKEQRESAEYTQLLAQNNRLWWLLSCIDVFCKFELHKDICITSVFRTPEEHKALYAATPNPPVSSPHMFWEAADIRSSDFTQTEIDRMVKFANEFTFRNGKQVALYHQVSGNAYHFHIQYGKS